VVDVQSCFIDGGTRRSRRCEVVPVINKLAAALRHRRHGFGTRPLTSFASTHAKTLRDHPAGYGTQVLWPDLRQGSDDAHCTGT
jgi:nicotinamidase-related amidase